MITYAMLSKEGNRQYNEDSVYAKVNEEDACFALADGLGGQGNGDVASSYVTNTVASVYEKSNEEKDKEFVTSVILKCQNNILAEKQDEDVTKDMMSTLVLLLITEDKILWGHVGDSRLYFFENGKLLERTTDHSVPQVLASTGEIDENEIRQHPDRNRLLRAIGMVGKKEPLNSYKEIKRKKEKQVFLLCSDGFWEYIEEKKMEKLLKRAKNPQEWLLKMEKNVLKNGKGCNMDNYSAICVFVE